MQGNNMKHETIDQTFKAVPALLARHIQPLPLMSWL
jgi:hypothetical protein